MSQQSNHPPLDQREEFSVSPSAFEFLSELLPAKILTSEALKERIEASSYRIREPALESNESLFDRLARRLHRHDAPHLVLTGSTGIGKTETVRELARRSLQGHYPFLEETTFLWFDCSAVGPEDSRQCLETLLTVAREREQTILCLSGFATLFPRPNGGTNKPLILAAARRPEVRIIGLMQPHEYQDLIGSDVKLREIFGGVELTEPDHETTLEIARHEAARIASETGQTISDEAVQRAVVLSSSFLFQQAQPGKTVRILRQACEDARFEQTQLGREKQPLGPERINRVLEELTGIPATTFSGIADDIDYHQALESRVVGQSDAIDAVAGELQLIKAGLVDPGKPASVLLFAGMTGVGKTELARRVAELYSGTRKLNVYTMGNFSEPHSVSAIIGVPPGYVGHEEGGRLINELNSDPYAVFLLDEAEKAHPNVWKPFLNLFDEGWIVDQRGVKAYADRAIFILTTNAGADGIAQMTRSGKSEEEIEERVKSTLARVRQERSSQPVFTPQFLARIKRTVIFAPLDEVAMLQITKLIVQQIKAFWQNHRNKELIIEENLIQAVAYEAYRRNEKSGGKEGGRIIRKLIADLIERRILAESLQHRQRFQSMTRIVVKQFESTSPPAFDPDESTPPSEPTLSREKIQIVFE
jgi:ATP-dependent Clp protease ATP-binding subunit ClpA